MERFLFGLRPYHCSHCDHRFYAPMPANEVPMRSKFMERLHSFNPFTKIAFRTNVRARSLEPPSTRISPDVRVHTTTRIVSTMASTKLSKT